MAQYSQNYEGNPAGTTISTTNSANGTNNSPFYTVSINGTSTLTYDATQAAHGTQSAKIVPSSGNTVGMNFGGTATGAPLNAASCAARWYMYLGNNIASTGATQLSGMTDATPTRAAGLYLDNTGKLYVRDSGSTPLWTASAAMPLNQWMRLEYWIKIATNELHVAYYQGDSTTAVGSFDSTTASIGSNPMAVVSLGRLFNTSNVEAFWVDDFCVDTAATGFIGPVATTTPLTLSGVVTPSSHIVGQTQTLTLTAGGGNGNPISYSVVWDGTSLGPQSSNVFTHVDSTAGTKNWSATASQSA